MWLRILFCSVQFVGAMGVWAGRVRQGARISTAEPRELSERLWATRGVVQVRRGRVVGRRFAAVPRPDPEAVRRVTSISCAI